MTDTQTGLMKSIMGACAYICVALVGGGVDTHSYKGYI